MRREFRFVIGFIFMVAFAIVFIPIVPVVAQIYQYMIVSFLILGFIVLFGSLA